MKRKMIYNMIRMSFAVLLTAGIGSGCTERELSERPDDGPLKIRIVWPEEATGKVSGARLLLYGSDGSLHKEIACGADGHECRVPADTYTILTVNADCTNAGCMEHASAAECCMCAEAHPTEEGVVLHVQHVYSTGEEGIEVRPGNAASEVTLYPQNRVKHLHFDIDPDYVDDIAGMTLRMTGVVPSVLLADGSDAQDETQHVLADASAADGGHYAADMSVFGWRGENIVTATVRYTDGSEETTLPQDIGGQLEALPAEGGTVNITLALPDGGEITLTVTVKAWESGSGSGTVI